MELVLVRTYHADGTNGMLRCFEPAPVSGKLRLTGKGPVGPAKANAAEKDRLQNSKFICYTIELPWEDNCRNDHVYPKAGTN